MAEKRPRKAATEERKRSQRSHREPRPPAARTAALDSPSRDDVRGAGARRARGRGPCHGCAAGDTHTAHWDSRSGRQHAEQAPEIESSCCPRSGAEPIATRLANLAQPLAQGGLASRSAHGKRGHGPSPRDRRRQRYQLRPPRRDAPIIALTRGHRPGRRPRRRADCTHR